MNRLTPRLLPTALILLAVVLVTTAHAQESGDQRGIGVRRADEPKRTWPERSKRWALVIGVDEYEDGQISRLSGAANDARALHDALVENAGFPAEQVVLLTTGQERGLQPRRNTILRYLSNLRSNVPKDGLLLLSFSGHGIERSGHSFLLPSDAEWSNDMRLLQETALDVAGIRDGIAASGVSQVVLLLDGCRNDPEPGRSGGDNRMTKGFADSFDFGARNREIVAFAAFYATAVGERAYEYRAKSQGYFTWAVVEGLRGAAVNERGEVTLAALSRYVQEKVPRYVQRDLGAEGSQRPFSVIEGYLAEELVIATAAAPHPPAGPPPMTDATRLMVEEASFWGSIKDSRSAGDFEKYLLKYPGGMYVERARKRLADLPVANAPSETVTPVPNGPPLAKSEIITMLQIGISPARVEQFVEKRGVNFQVTPEIAREITAAGGNRSLVGAITEKSTAVTTSHNASGAPRPVTRPAGPAAADYDDLIDRATTAVSTQDFNGAIRYAQQAAQLDPQQPTAHSILGTIALYYSKDFSVAEQAMRAAIERGGAAAFHVYHDHDGSFNTYCEGSFFVTKTGVSFKANDGRDSFNTEDSNIKEAKVNGFVGSQLGAFHIKLVQKVNGRDNSNFAPSTRSKAESELLIRLIQAY